MTFRINHLSVLLFLSFLLIQQFVLASNRPLRWGKLSKEEKELKIVSYDKEAHAVVLGATGRLTFRGNKFFIEKHIRVKILDSEGTEEGSVVIPFYAKNNMEKVGRVKGHTLEILPDGKIKKHKLEKDQIFQTSIDENWTEVRFAFPAVKPGCIIEYSYTLSTENFTFLDGWNFQSSLPTLYSSFKVEIPSFLQYYHLLQGARLYKKYQHKTDLNEWTLENLPALKKEPYTFNLLDFAERVRFQLHSYTTSDSYSGRRSQKTVFTDWQSISNEVLANSMFHNYLKRNKSLEELAAEICKGATDDSQRINKLYRYVQANYRWNQQYGILPDRKLKNCMQEQSANGAAINLLLLSLLQKAGLEAYPGLLSTKSHGKANPNHAILSQFNHTISVVKLQGRDIPLDAAGNLLPPGLLPEEDLNEKALILLSEKRTDWHQIKDNANTTTLINYLIDLPKGIHHFSCRWKGYDAVAIANQFAEKDFSSILSSPDFTLNTDSLNLQKALWEKNMLEARVYSSEETSPSYTKETVYYLPAVPDFLKEHPFLAEERNLPVDFGHTSTKHLRYSIVLPEGFTLEEKPKSILLKTPQEQALFSYQSGLSNGILTISIRLEIKEALFTVEQYPHLRELFSQIISHCQQPLVLVRSQAKE